MKLPSIVIAAGIATLQFFMVECGGSSLNDVSTTITGRVVGVHDGDSITLLTDSRQQIKVRLDGIDAPELRQAFGQKSKVTLSGLVMSRQVTIEDKGEDRYKRTLAVVKVNDLNVNLEMVRLGYAWHYLKYSKNQGLAAAEREAREAKRGLWADDSPVPPWDWRRR